MGTENHGRVPPQPAQNPRGSGTPGPEAVSHPETMYERRDLSPRAIFGFLVALGIGALLMHVALWSMYKYVTGANLFRPAGNPIMTSNRELRPMGDPAVTFPAPRLQPDPVADENKFRAYEDEVLNTYGWVNRQTGVVHIPIEQAIDIVAERGLPTRAAPAETSSASDVGTGEQANQREAPKATEATR
jgi:hypothetical protein